MQTRRFPVECRPIKIIDSGPERSFTRYYAARAGIALETSRTLRLRRDLEIICVSLGKVARSGGWPSVTPEGKKEQSVGETGWTQTKQPKSHGVKHEAPPRPPTTPDHPSLHGINVPGTKRVGSRVRSRVGRTTRAPPPIPPSFCSNRDIPGRLPPTPLGSSNPRLR